MNTLIRQFKTKNFTVAVRAEEDYDIDLSWDEDGSVLKALENGSLCSFAVSVRVYYHGAEVGADNLGGCIYARPADFMDHVGIREHNRKTGHNCGSYFSDMVHEAIADARKFMADTQKVYLRAA